MYINNNDNNSYDFHGYDTNDDDRDDDDDTDSNTYKCEFIVVKNTSNIYCIGFKETFLD